MYHYVDCRCIYICMYLRIGYFDDTRSHEWICDLFTEAVAEVNKHISPRGLKKTYLYFTWTRVINPYSTHDQ